MSAERVVFELEERPPAVGGPQKAKKGTHGSQGAWNPAGGFVGSWRFCWPHPPYPNFLAGQRELRSLAEVQARGQAQLHHAWSEWPFVHQGAYAKIRATPNPSDVMRQTCLTRLMCPKH